MAGDYILIELDKQRRLRFDVNALVEIEQRTGLGIQVAANQLTDDAQPKFGLIRLFVWAGLLHEEPTLTQQDVGRLITLANLSDVVAKLGQALTTQFPEGDDANPPMAIRSTGGT